MFLASNVKMRTVLLLASLLGSVVVDATTTLCYTSAASRQAPLHVPTHSTTTTPTGGCTKTNYHTTTYFVTHTPTKRVTSTSTKVVTDGLAFVVTSTITDTTTTMTVTTASTAVSTVSATTTLSSTSTSTIASSSGFIPVQSSLPDSSYNGSFAGPDASQRRLTRTKREVLKRHVPRLGNPQSVECIAVADTKCRHTVVSASIYTVTTTAKSTKTVTRTHVSTSTVAPSATSTSDVHVTATAASTVTQYTTTETLTTTTIVATSTPSAVFYEACDSSNLADNNNGTNIADIYPQRSQSQTREQTFHYFDSDNAYDCCVAGLMNPNTTGAFQLLIYEHENVYCELFGAPNQPGGGQNASINSFTAYTNESDAYSVVGNLYDGLINNIFEYGDQ